MNIVLSKKEDPAWLESSRLPKIAGTVILLQGDDPSYRISVPAPLLVACSPLVRNILSFDHLPPAFNTPIISIPSASVDILECVGEMMVSQTAIMDNFRLGGVREVFKMIGIGDLRDSENVDSDFGKSNVDTVEQEDKHSVKLEIIVKLEDTDFLHARHGQTGEGELASLSSFGLDQSYQSREVNPRFLIKKQLPIRNVKLKQAVNLNANCLEKTAVKEGKKTDKCPHCDKTLCHTSLKRHVLTVHKQLKKTCAECGKKVANLSKHRKHCA